MMNMEWIHTLQWSRVLFILFWLLLAPNNIEDWQNYSQTLKIIGLNIRDGSKVQTIGRLFDGLTLYELYKVSK